MAVDIGTDLTLAFKAPIWGTYLANKSKASMISFVKSLVLSYA